LSNNITTRAHARMFAAADIVETPRLPLMDVDIICSSMMFRSMICCCCRYALITARAAAFVTLICHPEAGVRQSALRLFHAPSACQIFC